MPDTNKQTALLFGGTGRLGQEIAQELQRQGYLVRLVARNPEKARHVFRLASQTHIADASVPGQLGPGLFEGADYLISALGKPLALSDKTPLSFWDVDYQANLNILEQAKQFPIKKFVYVSAFGADKHPRTAYFKAHEAFAQALRESGLPYAVVKPVALFSGLEPLLDLAKKGMLSTIGPGRKRTNPVHQADVAAMCVAALKGHETDMDVGGPEVFTRHALNVLAYRYCGSMGAPLHMPVLPIRALLPVVRLFDFSLCEKLAFFLEACRHDFLAPPIGKKKLEDYFAGIAEAQNKKAENGLTL